MDPGKEGHHAAQVSCACACVRACVRMHACVLVCARVCVDVSCAYVRVTSRDAPEATTR